MEEKEEESEQSRETLSPVELSKWNHDQERGGVLNGAGGKKDIGTGRWQMTPKTSIFSKVGS